MKSNGHTPTHLSFLHICSILLFSPLNDKPSNHFYTPTASSEALQPQKHFSLPTSPPPIYPHSPNKISTICFLALKDFFLFKSLLPTPTAYLGKNSALAIASFLGLSFRTPLLQDRVNVWLVGEGVGKSLHWSIYKLESSRCRV